MKSVKLKQYKYLFFIFGCIGLTFLFFVIWKGSKGNEDLKTEAHYKKEISTGIDTLSEKSMWIEISTNELNDIKKQNKDLQEQLDKIQKVVIGMGRAMHIFDNDKGISLENIGENENFVPPTSASMKDEGKFTHNNDSKDIPTEISGASFTGMRDFVQHVKSGNEENHDGDCLHTKVESFYKADYEKLAKSGIKTIKFSNTDNEYDLEENFIFAATYVRCALVGSVTVSAGVGASSNPQPVLLRLTDYGNLPNKVKGFLKDAMVIGAAYGELSSESVVIRLERIVKLDKHGNIGMDIPVQGYVAGENGDSRIRGIIIDRAGAAMRNAAIGGFFSGIADFLTINKSSAVTFEPNSGLAQFSPQKGSRMLEQGASKGIGNAVEKYADFYIKRAEQLQPVIQIDGGRKLTVVFTQSVKSSSVNLKKVRKSMVISTKFKRGKRK